MVATKIAFFFEGQDEGLARVYTVEKAAPDIRLSDLQACYEGPEGVFLVKTPDQYSFHWSLITDDDAEVPSCNQDLILAKVKPISKGGTWLSYFIEGTFDSRDYVALMEDKLPTQVTLRDVKRHYAGQPGAFFFKEEDPTTLTHTWVLVNDDNEIVPSIAGWIVGKIRLHAPSDIKYCVIAVHVEGLPHPYTIRIPKLATEVTMADVRATFQHLVPAGDYVMRSGGNFVPAPTTDDVNLPNEKGLIQLRLKPHNAPAFNPPAHPHVTVPDHPVAGQYELPPFMHSQHQLHNLPHLPAPPQTHSQQQPQTQPATQSQSQPQPQPQSQPQAQSPPSQPQTQAQTPPQPQTSPQPQPQSAQAHQLQSPPHIGIHSPQHPLQHSLLHPQHGLQHSPTLQPQHPLHSQAHASSQYGHAQTHPHLSQPQSQAQQSHQAQPNNIHQLQQPQQHLAQHPSQQNHAQQLSFQAAEDYISSLNALQQPPQSQQQTSQAQQSTTQQPSQLQQQATQGNAQTQPSAYGQSKPWTTSPR